MKPSDELSSILTTSFRAKLVSFAKLHLEQSDLAEDVVQEALLIAFRDQDAFKGQSGIGTWVYGILKNKIREAIRERYQQGIRLSIHAPQGDDEQLLHFFGRFGHWHSDQELKVWDSPEQLRENEEFMQILELCMLNLPKAQCQVFTLREVMEFESQEIANVAELSAQNVYVLLHRARLKLRSCLQKNWLEDGCESC